MAVTLSHQSALDVIRALRIEGTNLHDMDVVALAAPSAWVGKRLGMSNFDAEVWRWRRPTPERPLHILVPSKRDRVRGKSIVAHVAPAEVVLGPTLWLDEHTRLACPELVFLQMAEQLSFPALVMLGYELCGHFVRQADDPLSGAVIDGVPSATDLESIGKYLETPRNVRGLARARRALAYVGDHAMSAPEAVLATLYGLPPEEGGYGLGPVTLNERVGVGESASWERERSRYPDLMFGFASIGLNYDGSKHFDVLDLMATAEMLARLDGKERDAAREILRKKLLATRAKVLDDNMRDRQLAAQGRIVFSVTKEDLFDSDHLDELTRQILDCAQNVFDADVEKYRQLLEDTSYKRERQGLLGQLLPYGHLRGSSYGRL